MKTRLQQYDLSPDNTIVIGSGILQALGLRGSKDIDLVVTQDAFELLQKTGDFSDAVIHGKPIISNDLFEIGTSWTISGIQYIYDDLLKDSVVIDGVRYITLDFLLKAKKSWVASGDVRQKDLNDIAMIEEYERRHKKLRKV